MQLYTTTMNFLSYIMDKGYKVTDEKMAKYARCEFDVRVEKNDHVKTIIKQKKPS